MKATQRNFTLIIFLIVANFFVWLQPSVLGAIDGHFRPVTTQVELSRLNFQQSGIAHTWQGRAEKLRDCSFKRIDWYLGPRSGQRVRVSAHFTDPPQIRRVGELRWTGLVINLRPEDVVGNSHAYVYHQCPGLPWLTRTLFYEGREQK